MPTKEDESFVTIDKIEVKLTNLNKIYWPEQNYLKKDLIDYYRAIAKIILPYLIDRPESLHRFPDGISQPGFFQKNIESAPKWVATKELVSESSGEINYLLCQNEATLVYMANLGCIDLNPWLSKINNLDYPDFCVLDLDPEEVKFEAVVKTAQEIHHTLEDLEIEGYCKTSGKRGLHIYIPLAGQYTYDQSVKFAQIIATIVHSKLPEITSLIRSPSKRQGKVYIDCLQNRMGQTVAAPYCVRPKNGATVSTPLRWDEVIPSLDPTRFTIKTIFNRLEKMDDIFKPVLGKGIRLEQIINKLESKNN